MNWYCVQTKPKKERALVHYLEESLDLEVFYPRVKAKKVIRRVKREVILPLFPRYLFCRFDLASHFRAVRYSPDSLGLVTCGGLPVAVDDSIIRQLKERTGGDVMVASLVEDCLRAGDPVRVLDGPLQGMMGTVLRDLSEGSRVAVLLTLLNCEARVSISPSQLSLERA